MSYHYEMLPGHVEAGYDVSRRVKLTPASEIGPLPVRWLWEDRIPVGEITLTAGFAGVGKSTFHAYIIAGVTTGTLPGVHHGSPKPVIICAREDSWQRSIVPRLMAAGADLELVYRAEVETGEGRLAKVTLPADNDALEDEIERLSVALVSVDPLLSAIEDHLDSYKSAEIRDALEPLQEMADRTRSVFLANAHYNKGSGSTPLLKIAGAAAFGEVARAAIVFAEDDETGDVVISQEKNNLGTKNLPNLTYRFQSVTIDTEEGPSDTAKIEFTGESNRSVADILNPPRGDEDRGAEDIARDRILDTLEAGPQSWETIAKAIKGEGISERTGRRARDDLRKSGMIGKSGGGGAPWTWHRKVVGQSRVGLDKWPSSSNEDDEVGQTLDTGLPNGDAYLSNLSKEEENLPARDAVRDVGQCVFCRNPATHHSGPKARPVCDICQVIA